MFDSAQRNIHYLRLSVTDLCNLRCRYCMPDGVEKLEREAVLTYEEFLRLAALFARCGVDTVRVTGGEPLVRKGVDQLVAGLKSIPGIRKVTMTTNGILLAQQLPALLEEIFRARGDVMLDTPQYLGVQTLDASGIVLRFWVKVAEKNIYAGARALNRELLLGFRRLGVECPFPQMDVHMK